jgi:FkbM family methyltransferase
MIDPNAIITYAQYNEDLILSALLYDVDKGFYVDVGANYPVIDSVTKLFYKKGWRGINIEPIESLYNQLAKDRPKDINLHCGVGLKTGTATFREYTAMPGHSTFDVEQMEQHGQDIPSTDYKVPIRTLADIFKDQLVKHIHFLKVDVEGFEYEVVKGNDWQKHRPEVVCIEANHVSKDWRPILTSNDYKLFIFDGLNEYYVAEESWGRTQDFAERVAAKDYHAIKKHHHDNWLQDVKSLKHHIKLAMALSEQNETLKQKTSQLEHVATLSLKGRPMRSRIKRAVYGLTIDWYRFKKESSKKK